MFQLEDNFKLGVSYANRGKYRVAIKYFERCIELNPKFVTGYINLGSVYTLQKQHRQALIWFLKALDLEPANETVLYNLGICYHEHSDLIKAKQIFEKLVDFNPQHADAYNELGTIYNDLGQAQQAVDTFQKSLFINPNHQLALYNLGRSLALANQDKVALPYLEKAYQLNPHDSKSLSLLYSQARSRLDWPQAKIYSQALHKLTLTELKLKRVTGESPWINVTRIADPKLNLQVAGSWSLPLQSQFNFLQHSRSKLRIGYVSDGFRDFTTTHNISGVLENHDRSKFEIYAYSLGSIENSIFQERIRKAVHKFRDYEANQSKQIAKLIAKDQIDILVDLKGYTRGGRPEIFSYKPAPIIVSYLGFVGTMGSGYHDYFIADKIVVSPEIAKYFSEKLIYLPHSYWPTDNKLKIASQKFDRSDFNIPKNSFVFASFNQSYKIELETFRSWLTILKHCPQSVLLIYVNDLRAKSTIITFAQQAGLDPKRLVILTQELAKSEHLARIRDLADLALDTQTVNGHTTTTDCLWAGVPVLTILGKHFASRVSASLLTAIGLPELITKNFAGYRRLAESIAKNPNLLAKLKNKLQFNRQSYPLFDTARYTLDLEKAYEIMWTNYLHAKRSRLL